MLTQFVHIGDLHLAPGPRHDDVLAALDQIIDAGLALPHLGAWIDPGDIGDILVGPMTSADRLALDARFRRMASVAPVVICPGNHDDDKELLGFANLATTHPIYVVTEVGCVRLQCATGALATIFVLPYPDKRRLVTAGVAVPEIVHTAAELLEPIFMVAAQQLDAARARGDLTLMIGHFNVAGAITSTGQPNIGREIEISNQHLDRLGRIPKLLNHIHKPQEIDGAHYAGSVCRLSYGEAEPKSYSVLEMGDDVQGWTIQSGWTITRHPIDIAPMFLIEGEMTRAGFVPDEASLAVMSSWLSFHPDWYGCDVRVRYRYPASERSAIDPESLRVLFPGAKRFKAEGHAIIDRELRAPAVAAETTVAGKLGALRQEPLDDRLLGKLALLEGADEAALLADVDATLAAITDAPVPTPETATVAA